MEKYVIEYGERRGCITVELDERRSLLSGKYVYRGQIFNASKEPVGIWFCNDACADQLRVAWQSTSGDWHISGTFCNILSAAVESVIYGFNTSDCPF